MEQDFSGLYDDEMWECIEFYLNLPDSGRASQNPLNYAHIHDLQQHDNKLLGLQVKHLDSYVYMELDDYISEIICYKKIQPRMIGRSCYHNQCSPYKK